MIKDVCFNNPLIRACRPKASLRRKLWGWLERALCMDSQKHTEQIRFLLGHASVPTTERYIGSKQKLQDAVNDRFEILVAKYVP